MIKVMDVGIAFLSLRCWTGGTRHRQGGAEGKIGPQPKIFQCPGMRILAKTGKSLLAFDKTAGNMRRRITLPAVPFA